MKPALMAATQRSAVHLPQAHHIGYQNTNDLEREAVGCNGGLGALATDAGLLPA
jgi:hypothetical protein